MIAHRLDSLPLGALGFDAESLVYVLAHSLWQAPLWAAVLWATLRLVSSRHPEWRYGFCMFALVGVVASTLLTGSLIRLPVRDGSATGTIAGPAGAETGATVAVSALAEHLQEERQAPAAFATAAAASRVVIEGDGTVEGGGATESAAATEGGAGERDAASPATFDSSPQRAWWWPRAVVGLWLVGAAVMLVRRGRSLVAARSLAEGTATEDAAVLELLQRVKASLGIRRAVRLVMSDRVTTPLVVGALRPTLVLPISLVTGLSPVELQAIFAHELAHIRRHDFLVNVVQLVVEALLFFNPAIWWISRQVRCEREACCDAIAASIAPSPLRYAEMLLAWVDQGEVRRSRQAASPERIAAVAMVGSEPGGLLDRIERLLTPGYRPTPRISRRTGTLMLLLACAGVVLLQRGSDLAVAVAADWLTDEQRIERLVEVRETVHPNANETGGSYTLAGRVRTSDGERPPALTVYLRETTGKTTTASSKGLEGDRFEYQMNGETWLAFDAPGYAAAVRGPFRGASGTTVAVPEVVLQPGFRSWVRVTDTEGNIVPGAQLQLLVALGNAAFNLFGPISTGDSGVATLEHLSDHLHTLQVEAAGFEPLELRDLRFEPGGETVLALKRSQPTTGRVRDAAGNPAANVEVWQYKAVRSGHGEFNRKRLAVTDSEGRFVLDQLRDGATYLIYLQEEGRVAQVIDRVQAGQRDLEWQLRPELTARGRVLGELPAATGAAPAMFRYTNNLYGNLHGFQWISAQGPARQVPLDDDGSFAIDGLTAGELILEIADRRFWFKLTDSRDDLVVDLSAPEATPGKRPVILTFKTAAGPAALRGSAVFESQWAGGQKHVSTTQETIPLEFDGPTVRLEAFAPGVLSAYQPKLVGFWFEGFRLEVPAGEGPYERAVDVLPAGAVTGRVLRADGTPAIGNEIHIGGQMAYRSESGDRATEHFDSIRVNERGEFFASPVILGAETVLKVSEGHNIQISEPLTLTRDEPTAELTVVLPPAVRVQGRVLDEQGNPISRIPLGLTFEHELWTTSFSPAAETGPAGRFAFEGLNAETGKYWLEIESRRDFVPTRVPVRTDGKAMQIRLERGHRLTGTVLDNQGQPVGGVEVYARPTDWTPSAGKLQRYEAEDPTDAEGRFRFSNLPEGPVQLNTRQMFNLQPLTVHPAASEPIPDVTLQGEVASWHRGRPK